MRVRRLSGQALRRLERALLGALMALVALVLERRLRALQRR